MALTNPFWPEKILLTDMERMIAEAKSELPRIQAEENDTGELWISISRDDDDEDELIFALGTVDENAGTEYVRWCIYPKNKPLILEEL